MLVLGLANTRLKDFYDIWILARTHGFKDERFAQAFAEKARNIQAER